jgi:hypothetical protein
MKNETRLQLVETKELTAVGYNAQSRKAVVVFRATGGTWEFVDVPVGIGQSFLSAADPERFIQSHLMKRYHVRRLTPRPGKRESLRPPAPPQVVPVTPPPAPAPVPVRKPWRRWAPCARQVSIPHEPVMSGQWDFTTAELSEVSQMKRLAEMLGELPHSWLARLTPSQRGWLSLRLGALVPWQPRTRRLISVSGRFQYRTVGD